MYGTVFTKFNLIAILELDPLGLQPLDSVIEDLLWQHPFHTSALISAFGYVVIGN